MDKENITIDKIKWGTVENKEVDLYTIKNKNGFEVKITNYGGIITSILAPDKNGKYEEVVLGFDSLAPYLKENPYFGSLIGRYANRIAKGKFRLNGIEYTVATNNGPNHLHGGIKGFNKQVWDVLNEYSSPDSAGLTLTYLSKDMEEGYPGDLFVTVNYTITSNNEIKIRYHAQTDKPTVLNLTNHSYFNLTSCKEDVLNHLITINADSITPVDSTLIPTGAIVPVKGTDFDFTTARTIGKRINSIIGGYDMNYVLRKGNGQIKMAATVYEPSSGRVLEVYTTQPGIQFYSGNFLDGSLTGHNGTVYLKYYGLCLETQHFPDSPNHPNFPTTILNPEKKYNQLTIYRFKITE